MKVTGEMADRAAELARLKFTPEERTDMCQDLERILGYMEQLALLNTDDTPPEIECGAVENELRKDMAAPSICRELLLGEAPEQDGACYLVPYAVEQGI